jgi:signal transduction histidine kinase/ActR/RegA family two-component response regulator
VSTVGPAPKPPLLPLTTEEVIEVKRQASLLKTGALQDAIFNSANFSSIATDEKGVIQIFNVGAERMLGYAAADVMNKITPADISDPQELIARATALSLELATPIRPGFDALVFKASRGIEDIYELTYIRKDGSRFPAVVSVTALRNDEGGILGYLLIGTDNTARKLVEAERKRLDQLLLDKNVELESAKSVAEKANLAKSEFLSSMSHELRSPLNAILGFAQLMESETPPPTASQNESVTQILQAGWHLLKLIDEILDLARVESGQVPLSREPVSMAEVMAECQGMLEPLARPRELRMKFPTFEAPSFVHADPTRVKQVLLNLLSNAIKYNVQGGTIDVTCVEAQPGRIRTTVRDSGVGLRPDQHAQLFQAFNRLGQEIGPEQGTGIGLVVAKQLVELMGGSIGVESAVGTGSSFWFDLVSAAEPLVHAAKSGDALVKPSVPVPTRRHTLLYVEDNPANLRLVEQIVARDPSITFLTAMTGPAGVEMARELKPDVILMDINLPGFSGFQALELLRADPATAHIPVIALSASAMKRDVEKGLKAGFLRYMSKPIRVSEFMEALTEALNLAAPGRR